MEKNELIKSLYDIREKQQDKQIARDKCETAQKDINNILNVIEEHKSKIIIAKNSAMKDNEPKRDTYNKKFGDSFRIILIISQIIILLITLFLVTSYAIRMNGTPTESDEYIQIAEYTIASFVVMIALFILISSIIEDFITDIKNKKFDIKKAIKTIVQTIIGVIIVWIVIAIIGAIFLPLLPFLPPVDNNGIINIGILIGSVSSIIGLVIMPMVTFIYNIIYNVTLSRQKYQKACKQYLENKPEMEKQFKDTREKQINELKELIKPYNEQLKNAHCKYEEVQNKFKEIEDICNVACNKISLHSAYQNEGSIKCFIDYLEKGRADNLKECINLYETEVKQIQMEKEIANAKNIANNAVNTANNAVNAANNASNIAYNAVSTANAAKKEASTANTKADRQERIQDEYHKESELYKDIKRRNS